MVNTDDKQSGFAPAGEESWEDPVNGKAPRISVNREVEGWDEAKQIGAFRSLATFRPLFIVASTHDHRFQNSKVDTAGFRR